MARDNVTFANLRNSYDVEDNISVTVGLDYIEVRSGDHIARGPNNDGRFIDLSLGPNAFLEMTNIGPDSYIAATERTPAHVRKAMLDWKIDDSKDLAEKHRSDDPAFPLCEICILRTRTA